MWSYLNLNSSTLHSHEDVLAFSSWTWTWSDCSDIESPIRCLDTAQRLEILWVGTNFMGDIHYVFSGQPELLC